MRNRLTIIPIAALVLAACGDKRPKASDANAAEVSAVSSESTSASAPTPVVTGPVSFEEANTAFKEKRYDEAARLFATYSTAKPDNVWGYYMLGLSAWKAGDRDRAVDAFRRALEQDSTHVKSQLNLSRVLIEQDKAQEALPHVEAALKIDSGSSEGFRLLGRVKSELGDTAGAIGAYRQSLVLDDRDVWSLNNLARVYIGQGQFAQALGPLARAIEIDSTVPSFHNNLGIALERTGHSVQAAEQYRAAVAIDSTHGKAAAGLTRVAGLKQDPALAPVDLHEAARNFLEQSKTWR
ncbi:MAG TPA: tetratricopeptide repeat protein [Gemmatimonadales bacterium]|nr:tetratricopeptide repeat protein [Gemmatimonadales bacterium]